MGDFQFLDIILFAAIAAFFVLRLRNVLGKRTGHENSQSSAYDAFSKRKAEAEDKVVSLPDRTRQAKDSDLGEDLGAPAGTTPLAAGLTQVRLADRGFDQEQFLGGAKAAFEMIVAAFARGDAAALRPLLANDVFADFNGAIEERQRAGHILETTLVGIKEADLIEAEMQGRTAFVTVKFVSDQINVMKDKDGAVVEGDPSEVTSVTDIWTFARNTRSRDPNWTLVATQSPN
jgi:predicted lipid-binding transport protein (Tim44 family)